MTLKEQLLFIQDLESLCDKLNVNAAKYGPLIHAKREYRKYLRLCNSNNIQAANWHYDNDGESAWHLYLVDYEDYFFSGPTTNDVAWQIRKARLLAYLWENRTRVTSDYDCSGQWFTDDIRVAYVKDGTFMVYEHLSLDI